MNSQCFGSLLLACTLSAAAACTVNVDDGMAGMAGAAGDGGVGGAGSGGGSGTGGSGGNTAFQDAVEALGALVDVTEGETEVADQPTEDRCGAVTYWERTDTFDRVGVDSTHGPELFPGNVVVGADALEGQLNRVNGSLAPVTYSLSIGNTADVSDTLDMPSLNSYRTSLNALLNSAMNASSPAMLEYRMSAVTSQEELSTALGGSVGFFGLFTLGGQQLFSSTAVNSRFVVSFEQTYYTVDAEPKNAPSDVFSNASTPAVDSPPLYVRSIRYGRRVLLFVASQHYEAETRTVLNAGFNDVSSGVSFGANFDDGQRNVYDGLQVHAVVIGGSASSAVMAINDLSSLGTLLADGAQFSPTQPGAPIDFQLAHVLDNSVAVLSQVSEYEKHSCVDLDVTKALEDACGDPDCTGEFFGPIDLYVTEDPADPCGVLRLSLLAEGEGVMWSGAAATSPSRATLVPTGSDRPICVRGHLFEEDVLSNDDYGAVDLPINLAMTTMTATDRQSLICDPDQLWLAVTTTNLGASAGHLP